MLCAKTQFVWQFYNQFIVCQHQGQHPIKLSMWESLVCLSRHILMLVYLFQLFFSNLWWMQSKRYSPANWFCKRRDDDIKSTKCVTTEIIVKYILLVFIIQHSFQHQHNNAILKKYFRYFATYLKKTSLRI